MKKIALAFLLGFALLALSAPIVIMSGCAQVGMQQPRNFSDELAYSYAAVTSVRLSTATALAGGQITIEDAQRVQGLSDQARALLDAAKIAHEAQNDTSAAATLASAAVILAQLQQLVAVRGK